MKRMYYTYHYKSQRHVQCNLYLHVYVLQQFEQGKATVVLLARLFTMKVLAGLIFKVYVSLKETKDNKFLQQLIMRDYPGKQRIVFQGQ